MNIIKCTANDLDEIYDIECEAFQNPLTKTAFEKMMQNPSVAFFAVELSGCLRAFVCCEKVFDEWQIVSVAVRPECRRCGHAEAIFEYMKRLSSEYGVELFTLEVRSQNLPALSLYKKLGFTEVGRSKCYYDSPTDDAILMDLVIRKE
ncbi:MAG: ribosomal protein S18-alanine N-acetyltransferase [Clostridia bacterium]|nr:ribosomal protein S18-alanine N-acetyltransferase [Clostridia bacterium]